MQEGVFFSVPFIFHQEKISIFSFIIASCITFIFYLFYFWIKNRKNLYIKHNYNYIFPKISSKSFSEDLFLLMQKFALINFFPKNSYSHTITDIEKYCNNTEFLNLYRTIENIIFQKKTIHTEEKKIFLEKVKQIINNHHK